MSTTDQGKCGITSFIPMSCRNRAEAFAHHLHDRLRHLGTENGGSDERTWLGNHESSRAINCQPHSESYLNFDLESPSSPQEEIPQAEFSVLITNEKDDLVTVGHVANGDSRGSLDSDSSDGTFYDTEPKLTNGIVCNGTGAETEELLCNGTLTPEESLEYLSTSATQDLSKADDIENLPLDSDSQNGGGTPEPIEIFSSTLTLDKELVLECPLIDIQVSACNSVDKESEEAPAQVTNHEGDYDEKYEPLPRVRRCSSLKTGKTPPGTPGRKKIVRFADVFGLDLADVRTFLDEVPKVPKSAYDDLQDVVLDVAASSSELTGSSEELLPDCGSKATRLLMPLFQQPGGEPAFLDRVRNLNVCLENAVIGDPVDLSIVGTVRVRNLDFNKSVHVRYSLDSWKSFADMQGIYVPNSCDGFSDKFSFLLYAHTLTIGQRIEFAVRFQCKGSQYWDNNYGTNYCFQCLPASNTPSLLPTTTTAGHDEWSASFY